MGKFAKTRTIASLLNAGLLVVLVTCQGCSQPARGSADNKTRAVEISIHRAGKPLRYDVLEVGTLVQGGQFEQPIWFRNGSQAAQQIVGYSSSCECLTITGLPVELAAGGSAAARVRIDLQETPNTSGDFEIVVGLDVAEAESLPLKVRFTVEEAREPGGQR